MTFSMPYREFLADTLALLYLHSTEVQNLLVLILSKFRVHVSVLTVQEFLAYVYYRFHDHRILENVSDVLHKLYVVESISKDTVLKASMNIVDLVKHNQDFDIVDLYNVVIATSRNIPILTTDPSRYLKYAKYGVTTVHVKDFVEQVKSAIKA
ncbi:MAG: type II toxin-antitoxin system VapC family toxin [Desulfurococcaceae archaeon]